MCTLFINDNPVCIAYTSLGKKTKKEKPVPWDIVDPFFFVHKENLVRGDEVIDPFFYREEEIPFTCSGEREKMLKDPESGNRFRGTGCSYRNAGRKPFYKDREARGLRNKKPYKEQEKRVYEETRRAFDVLRRDLHIF